MKERPILFNSEMVRTILEGRKTQTRRVMKPQPVLEECDGYDVLHATSMQCPYGQRGDRLWAREQFYIWENGCPDGHALLRYNADGHNIKIDVSEIEMGRLKIGKTYPSIHMPRWASRITLEVVSVRVERVNSISEEDAIAEGFVEGDVPGTAFPPKGFGYGLTISSLGAWASARGNFALYWEKLNGKRGFGYDEDPWVWVVEFKRTDNLSTTPATVRETEK